MKDLYEDNQNKTDKIVEDINETLIILRNSFNSKEIPENKNHKNIVNIVEQSLTLTNNKKVKTSFERSYRY